MSLADRLAMSVPRNASTADMVEAYTSLLIASDALLGSAADESGEMNLYLHLDRIALEEVLLAKKIPWWESGPRFARIFGTIIYDDSFIRLGIYSSFAGLPERDDPDTWVPTAPGFERVRSAIDRLIATTPSIHVAHPARRLDAHAFWP